MPRCGAAENELEFQWRDSLDPDDRWARLGDEQTSRAGRPDSGLRARAWCGLMWRRARRARVDSTMADRRMPQHARGGARASPRRRPGRRRPTTAEVVIGLGVVIMASITLVSFSLWVQRATAPGAARAPLYLTDDVASRHHDDRCPPGLARRVGVRHGLG